MSAPPAYGGSPAPYPPQQAHVQGGAQDEYYNPQPQQGYPPQGPPGGYQQGPPMGYQQQQQGPPMGYPQQPPPQGQYADNRDNDRGMGGGGGCLAGICAAMACCCCLDCIF